MTTVFRDLELIAPAQALRVSFVEMAREYVEAGDQRHAAAIDDFDAYLERLGALERGEDLSEGDAPRSTFWLVSAGRVLAVSRLRHHVTPETEMEGGHIGYDVRPSERGNGLGKTLLRLTITKAVARGIMRICITCDDDNLASARIIEMNGGRLAGMSVSPRTGKQVRQYWIDAG